MKSHTTRELVAELRLFNHNEAADRLEKLDAAITAGLDKANAEDRIGVIETLARAVILSAGKRKS